MTIRKAYGVSDWPEEEGQMFEIITALPGESDADLIKRAKSHYSDSLQVVVLDQ